MGNDNEKQVTGLDSPECHEISEAEIDKTLDQSFPASDPPSWTLGVVPCADPEEDKDGKAPSQTKESGD